MPLDFAAAAACLIARLAPLAAALLLARLQAEGRP
jgi:hypothetical protein